ncbi:MAG TPA: phenylalanine--tRNA ligase subunit beta [Actinomycetota bacterium]|nr:phenylalanine--tRNA ligase subunit beta [Actinomycetota bacterium]
MKVVLSWLRELCPTDLSADELAELLTSKGAEVESVEWPWAGLSGVLVARVVEVRDHPDSDRLCVARVQTGSGELEVVVGVRNMGPGDLVPLAPPGARVPLLAEPLGARRIRGVISNGMLCAPDELGISPSHEGILILPPGLEPGADVAATFGLTDAVLDIEVTPNRPDFLSVLGIAREVAAATGSPLRFPEIGFEEAEEPAEGVATLEVLDLERCPRYLARLVRGVRDAPSPIAVQARLFASGMRPISAAVDATNYAMLEIGQPLHPFDLALLKGPGIVVRRATEGERLVTLDDVERTFTPDDLLICDTERPVAVAGVMGGELAEVSASTADILLESASFDRGGIQRTRRRIELSTEATVRFERGVDPEAVPLAADRACRLMAEWCGAEVLRGVLEVGGAPERRRILMRASRATALIGYPVSPADASQVFDRLDLVSRPVDEDRVEVEVPGYRVDLEREVDLIEEVVRVQGYERVGSTLPAVRQTGGLPAPYAFVGRVRRTMRASGLREVRLIPFVSEADLRLAGDEGAIRVTNPLAADEGWLRPRLLPGLLKAVRRNAYRHVRSIALFETGNVFGLRGGAPQERPAVAFAMTGIADQGWAGGGRTYDFFDAKGVVEALLAVLGIGWSQGEPPGRPFHPGRSARVIVGGQEVGVVGEIHPRVAEDLDVAGRIAVGELQLEPLMHAAPGSLEVREVPRFPPIRRDLAFTVDEAVAAGSVLDALRDAAGDPLWSCSVFDVFTGPPLAEGTKSLAFSVDFRVPDRTLTDDEADHAVAAIVERLGRDFGAVLRTA